MKLTPMEFVIDEVDNPDAVYAPIIKAIELDVEAAKAFVQSSLGMTAPAAEALFSE